MNYHARYVRENGDELVLYRKCFGWLPRWFFTRYQPFNNKKRKIENEMDDLVIKLRKKYAALCELEEEETQINNEINKHPGEVKGIGPTKVVKLPMFPRKHKDMPEPKRLWEAFRSILEGGVADIASALAGSLAGAKFVAVNNRPVGKAKRPDGEDDGEAIGSTNHPIRPESRNQQKKQQHNQNNRQQ